VTTVALSLAGLGVPSFAKRLRVESNVPPASPDDPGVMEEGSLVRYAGLFAHPSRPAAGLERMLADYFGASVAVEQFTGKWQPLDGANQTRLGRQGQNDQLGVSVVVGRRVWDVKSGIRIRIGPLDLAGFVSYLPDAAAGRRKLFLLAKLTRFYTRASLDFEVRLVLKASEVPVARLAKGGPGPRLGWNAWLGKRSSSTDADDAAFRCNRLLRKFAE
jgi:type VI secretion system protein ImpH